MSSEIEWPREIWMAERDEHDQGLVRAVLSEHATVPRWDGDPERDREFHRYVDADIHESSEKYWRHQSDALTAAAYYAAADAVSEWAPLSSPSNENCTQEVIHDICDLTREDAQAALEGIVRDAVEAERERCAAVAKMMADSGNDFVGQDYFDAITDDVADG